MASTTTCHTGVQKCLVLIENCVTNGSYDFQYTDFKKAQVSDSDIAVALTQSLANSYFHSLL